MLLIKTITGQVVNADSVQIFAIERPADSNRYIVRAKTEDCQLRTDLGYYWSPERACEELEKLTEFLGKRNNGVYVMTDITRKEEKYDAKEVVDQMFDSILQSLENLHGGFTREDILKAAKTELPYPYVDLEDLGFTVEEIKEYGRAN